jgi:hypothetical protein
VASANPIRAKIASNRFNISNSFRNSADPALRRTLGRLARGTEKQVLGGVFLNYFLFVSTEEVEKLLKIRTITRWQRCSAQWPKRQRRNNSEPAIG